MSDEPSKVEAPEQPDHSGWLAALEQRDQARDKLRGPSTVEIAAAKLSRWKNIGGAFAFFITLVTGAVITFQELQAKPTVKQVDAAIETAIVPVRAKAADVDKVKIEIAAERKRTDRLEQVVEYTMERDEWQYDVVSHVAARKRGKPPGKPPSLKAKEKKLLGIGK